MPDIKARYWAMLDQQMMEYEYFNCYLLESKRNESIVKAVSSVSGSASMVSLALWNLKIWDRLEFVKPLVMSFSGIIAFASQFLPYAKRANTAADLVPELWAAYLESEKDYLRVYSSELNNDEINELLYMHEIAFHEIKKKRSADSLFPHSKHAKKKAEKVATDRMKQRFCQINEPYERNKCNERQETDSTKTCTTESTVLSAIEDTTTSATAITITASENT